MRILVTGAAGFIGSHLVDYLFGKGYEVHGLDDLSGGFEKNLNPGCRFWKVDLRSTEMIEKTVVKIKPEIIFHLAADASEGRSQFTPINCAQRNYLATLNLLVPAIKNGLKRFVFTSSMAAYGSQRPPFTEEMELRPEDIYGVSKVASEKTIEILSKVHGFEYVIVRPHNVFGPRQNMTDPYRNVVTIFINRILKRKPIYIYGDGNQKRAFSYIDDIIPAMAKCGFLREASGEIFNLGNDKPFTINKLAKTLMEISERKVKIIYLPLRPCEVKLAYCSHKKTKRRLGYIDKTSLREGLKKTWIWASKEGNKKPVYQKIELDGEKLPLTWKKRLI